MIIGRILWLALKTWRSSSMFYATLGVVLFIRMDASSGSCEEYLGHKTLGTPKNVSIRAVNNTAVEVTWTAPSVMGQCVYQYALAITGAKRYQRTTNTWYTYINLQPNTEYIVKLKASSNSTGVFPESEEVTGKALTPPGKPGECVNLRSTSTKSNSVTLSWEKPLLKNGPIDGYLIEKEGEGLNETVNNSTQTFIGLEPYTIYHFSIYAYNIDPNTTERLIGPGKRLRLMTLPDEPGQITVLKLKPDRVSVSATWDKPLDPKGPIHGYLVTCFNDDNGEPVRDIETTDKSLVLPSLAPFTKYRVIVRAFNKVDDKKINGSRLLSKTKTLVDAPSEVRELRIRRIGENSLYASWKTPQKPNGPLSGFIIKSDCFEKPIMLEKGRTEYTIPNLEMTRKCHITIVAYNTDESSLNFLESTHQSILNGELASISNYTTKEINENRAWGMTGSNPHDYGDSGNEMLIGSTVICLLASTISFLDFR